MCPLMIVSKYLIPILPSAVQKFKILKKTTNKLDNSVPYMNLVMALYWIGRNYRFDILFACIFYATFSHCYTQDLYKEALKVLYFLVNTIDTTLEFNQDPTKSLQLRVECDASFGDFPVFCTLVYLNECLIHVDVAKNKSESIVDTVTVTSSTHAEMGAMFNASKLAVGVYKTLDPYIEITLPVMLFNDGKSAMFNLENLVTNKRTLHLDVKYRYVTELVDKKFLILLHKGTKILLADIGTKALAQPVYRELASKILNFKYVDRKSIVVLRK